MILTPVHPHPGSPLSVADPDTRDALRALYRREPDARGVRVNLIASVDGSVQGVDGTSESLSNRADRAILGAIRAESDVVLVGAATLRAEGYLLPRTARLAVVTGTGELGSARVGEVDDPAKVLVLGPESARERAAESLGAPHTFVALPAAEDGSVSLAQVVEALENIGAPRIVCEGGPSLVAALFDAGLVGELCLSTSPVLVGTRLPVVTAGEHAPVPLSLAGLLVDDAGGVYARWLPS